MRALTLTQPWAALVALGIKLIENRPRVVIGEDFHEPIAIHASREIDEPVYARLQRLAPELFQSRGEHTAGLSESSARSDWYALSRVTSAVIGVVTPTHTLKGWSSAAIAEHADMLAIQFRAITGRDDQLRWFFGPVGHVVKDARPLTAPVPCRGWQGLWTLTDDLAARVHAALPVAGGVAA